MKTQNYEIISPFVFFSVEWRAVPQERKHFLFRYGGSSSSHFEENTGVVQQQSVRGKGEGRTHQTI